jgi:hypothetical protein
MSGECWRVSGSACCRLIIMAYVHGALSQACRTDTHGETGQHVVCASSAC